MYVLVSWPESQKWMGEEYEDEIICGEEAGEIFVPEELYNQVIG